MERLAHKKPRPRDFDALVYLSMEIKRLRRALKIKPSPHQVREQTRRRVQAYRARQRASSVSGAGHDPVTPIAR